MSEKTNKLLANLLKKHWNLDKEVVIQVGDLIDRGKNSPQIVKYARELCYTYPNQIAFLKGNHEYEIISHFLNFPNRNWLNQVGEKILLQYNQFNRQIESDIEWFMELPLFWGNENIFISHAGISNNSLIPFIESDPNGVLWNRESLINIGKLQVVGHTPIETPIYNSISNSINIDTGAYSSRCLTGVKLTSTGDIIEIVTEVTDTRDI
ncbi:metallophosphoesterase [Bacillus cereus]|uniref:Serine/threonine protein phosphatase n=1 Tax=Bacillus cereus TaxID=1396 RepID=A0A2A7I1C0_BACCE|nr:metallophosphoesterase [Bacillus cereus]PEC22645.1 serine/threonine protein phosphatase [Bacillus cereus]